MADLRSRDASKTALRALMKNDKLSKVIRDGIKAPVGSTARKQAQQILSVVRKAGFDGAGGPGGFEIRRSVPQRNMSTVRRDYSNFVIFGNTPKLRNPIGKKRSKGGEIMREAIRQGVFDGAGGPGVYDGAGGLGDFGLGQGQQSSLGNFNPLGTTSNSTPQTTNKPGIFGSLVNSVRSLFGGGQQTSGGGSWGGDQGTTPSSSTPKVTWGIPAAQAQSSSGYQTGFQAPSQQGAAYGPVQEGAQGSQPDMVALAQQQAALAQQGAYQTPSSQNMPAGLGAKYPSIQAAVDSQFGPSMFAYQALSNPSYLKTLPGFSGLPASVLQGGGTLSGRIQQLDNALRSSYQLDSLLNQYQNLVGQGVGLEGRLTDYIRGRDQFLNETDGMLEDFKDKMLKMNLADPEIRKSAEMYSNYLYELRGRQNKRYIEFLNTSIDEYNTKLESVSGMYTTALDGYQRELTMKAAITQEEYQMMFGALTDMYNTVANAPMQALEMQKLQTELYRAEVAAAKDLYDMTKGTGAGSYLDSIDNFKKVGVIMPDGSLNPNISYTDAALYESLGVSDQVNFFNMIVNTSRNAMTMPDKDGNLPTIEKILSQGGTALDAIWNFNQEGQLSAEQAYQYSSQVKDSIANALFSNGVIGADKAEGIRAAVNYLSNSAPGIFNFSTPPSRAQLLEKAAKEEWGLDPKFLDALYTDFEGYGENRKQFAGYFLTDQNGGPLSDAAIASRVAYTFANKLGKADSPGGFRQVAGDTNQASIIDRSATAISGIESGGSYSAVGPVTRNGDRAYGKYQVMGANIPSWTKAALGYSMSPEQFLASPQAQEATFRHQFGNYIQTYGSPEDAASVWFTGRPIASNNNAQDVLGTSANEYVNRFMQSFYG